MQRRHFIAGSAALIVGTAYLRPHAKGMPYDRYFQRLNRLLQQQGPGRPVCLIDVSRLDQNIELIKKSLYPGHAFRIVAKSLPSILLLARIMKAMPTQRLMVFHQPQILALAQAFPSSDLLLGKPMPIQAVSTHYRQSAGLAFDSSRQLSWLIDTRERAEQYAQLARSLGIRMRVSLEIDVGLHRGGLQTPHDLQAVLPLLDQPDSPLQLAGMMGYDAQVGKIPSILESTSTSLRKSQALYQGFKDALYAWAPHYREQSLIMNGAGSPTFRLHDAHSPLNEVSAGSALVKASDFDLDILADLQPACWIATPVLKAWTGLKLPGPDSLGTLWSLWDPNRQRTYFIYGGEWMAHPVSPSGLEKNPLYGLSSNQEMYNGSMATQLKVDDQIFMRPTQSEWVLQQFGSLLALHDDQSMTSWSVLPS